MTPEMLLALLRLMAKLESQGDGLAAENVALRAEVERLKAENESLKAENESPEAEAALDLTGG